MWQQAPERVTTPRLVLRCWRTDDAPRLRAAIDESLPELKLWIPWAKAEPTPLPSVVERLERFRAEFTAGPEWGYAILDGAERELLGGIGLHARIGPSALEIGYWVRTSKAGQGIITEAAGAIVQVALALGAVRIEIHCDPENPASARVAEKLGFRHAVTRRRDFIGPRGDRRDSMIWVWPPGATPYEPVTAGT
jgi:RimJ/RimL family protein N-acetyltransferase